MNTATIYTVVFPYVYRESFMGKSCSKCSKIGNISEFRINRAQCRRCVNEMRRNSYKKSVCRWCSIEFRPGVEGRYKFCTEMCRFLHKVEKYDSGCWIWKGYIQRKRGGYGTFQVGQRVSALAHRVSFRLFNGSLDEKLFVLHSCHNPVCVNPDHLRQGTPLENTLDRKRAGRTTNPGKNRSV